jgi:hypothetical protein
MTIIRVVIAEAGSAGSIVAPNSPRTNIIKNFRIEITLKIRPPEFPEPLWPGLISLRAFTTS